MDIQRAVRISKQANSAPKPFHARRLRAFPPSSQHPQYPPPLDTSRVPSQPFVYHGMQIHHATRLMRQVCALKHLSINTEKSYIHWLGRYGSFLKALTAEKKIEAFLTRLALSSRQVARQQVRPKVNQDSRKSLASRTPLSSSPSGSGSSGSVAGRAVTLAGSSRTLAA
jgi:hypothetical protein